MLTEVQTEFLKKENECLQNTLSLIESKIEEIELIKTRGATIRSGAQWLEEGEKHSKYFFALEKRNFLNKAMMAVVRKRWNFDY